MNKSSFCRLEIGKKKKKKKKKKEEGAEGEGEGEGEGDRQEVLGTKEKCGKVEGVMRKSFWGMRLFQAILYLSFFGILMSLR